MYLKNLRFLNALVFLFFTSIAGYSQTVQSVEYLLKYDSTTCWYDFNIIILEGYAEGIGQRTQFNSQITVVVPTGSTVDFAAKYMPLQSNQFYGGSLPMNWFFGTTVSDPGASPGNDFVSILPTLAPTSQYNNIYAGDTIKLFSLEINSSGTCGEGIRLFENGVDPGSSEEDMEGADFSNGFTVGGISQLYDGNAPIEGPNAPTITSLTDNSGSDIDIDLEVTNSTCQGPVEFEWSGPNGYSSTTEDVFISPAAPQNFGEYQVIIKGSLGCADTTTVLVEQGGGSQQTDNLTVDGLILNSTFEHISAHLNITGDDNHNSNVTFEYRLLGETSYQLSSQVMRAFPEMVVDGAALNENFHAGSAMFLNPNSWYDLRITVNDPDGGSTVIDTVYFTQKMPGLSGVGNIIYVVPGNGGGNGTQGNPYQGLQTAADNVAAGDVVEVANGVYAPFTLVESGTENDPIVFKSTNLHGAVIDGGNTSSGIVTIGSYSDSIGYIIIDGFEIKNGSWAIDAQNTQHFTVRNNKIYDVDFGIYNRRENGWEHDQYFTNNEIIGRTTWPQTNGEIPAERGIDVRGNRNVISYNTITNFGDGISTDGAPYKTSYALDIHHNFINKVVDDLIEIDGVLSNARVYRNKGFNGRMGVSLAPVFGGPAYVFRNEFYNMEISTFKMNRSPAGLYITNNTAVKEGRGMTSDAGWQNTVFQNNAISSSHYCFEEYGLVSTSSDDWNYNGYKSLRSGSSGQPWFKWDDVQYSNVASLSASGLLASSSMGIEMSDFMSASIPSNYSTEAIPSNVNLEPSVGSDLLNSGVVMNNIQNTFVTDGLPDIGAIEKNQPLPNYGHDFTKTCDREDLSTRTWNGSVSQAWFHPDNWTPCGVPTQITDVHVPQGVPNYPFLNTDVTIKNLWIYDGETMVVKGENTVIRIVGE